MYKRQFYGVDHADNNGDEASSADSSSLDTDSDASAGDEEQDGPKSAYVSSSDDASDEGEPEDSDDDGEEEDEEWSAFRESRGPPKVQPLDSSLFLLEQPVAAPVEGDENEKEPAQEKVGDGMVLRVGGVFKCRLCVKKIFLTDETMKSHLLSKGHDRAVKRLANGTLKLQLDSNGEEVEETETHAERCERLRRLVEEKVEPVKRKKASSGRQRQRKRIKKMAAGTKETISAAKETISAAKETIPAAKETTPAKPTPTKTVEMPKTSKSPKGSKFVNGSAKKSHQVVASSDVSKTPKSSKKSPKVVESSVISKTPKSFKKFPLESHSISKTRKVYVWPGLRNNRSPHSTIDTKST